MFSLKTCIICSCFLHIIVAHISILSIEIDIGLCLHIWTRTHSHDPKWECVNMTNSTWRILTQKVNYTRTTTITMIHITISWPITATSVHLPCLFSFFFFLTFIFIVPIEWGWQCKKEEESEIYKWMNKNKREREKRTRRK